MRWAGFQKDFDMSEDNILVTYTDHLNSQLTKLRKKYKTAKMVFCQDERHHAVWRKQLYSEYKGTRGEATPILPRLQEIVKDTVVKYGTILGAPGLEADDIAYLTVKHLRSSQPDIKIVIVTSDRDYLQMTDENVSLVDGSGKSITGTGDPQKDLKIKILMGDPSDNIPPVCKGCGKKTAIALAEDSTKLAEFLQKKGCETEYARNEQLVCMDKIPAELVATFQAVCVPAIP